MCIYRIENFYYKGGLFIFPLSFLFFMEERDKSKEKKKKTREREAKVLGSCAWSERGEKSEKKTCRFYDYYYSFFPAEREKKKTYILLSF